MDSIPPFGFDAAQIPVGELPETWTGSNCVAVEQLPNLRTLNKGVGDPEYHWSSTGGAISANSTSEMGEKLGFDGEISSHAELLDALGTQGWELELRDQPFSSSPAPCRR